MTENNEYNLVEGSGKSCVYLHELDGEVVYVGSGCIGRVKHKGNRCEEHRAVWDKLEFKIIHTNLDHETSREIEERLIEEHYNTIFNIHKKTGSWNKVLYDEVSKFVEYDESVPQKLRWIGINKNKPAGGLPKRNGYSTVKINGVRYVASRVIYCIFNKCDIFPPFVVGHIDLDKSNLSPSNLQLVSQSENCKNKENLNTNTGFPYISDLENKREIRLTHVDTDGKRRLISFRYAKKRSRELAIELAVQKQKELRGAFE